LRLRDWRAVMSQEAVVVALNPLQLTAEQTAWLCATSTALRSISFAPIHAGHHHSPGLACFELTTSTVMLVASEHTLKVVAPPQCSFNGYNKCHALPCLPILCIPASILADRVTCECCALGEGVKMISAQY